MDSYKIIEDKAKLVRKWSMIATTEAGSGHPTSCLSAADIGTVLFNNYFTYDLNNPLNPHNDRFILSKGHAAPLFYTLFAMSGGLSLKELKTLRKFTSRLEGHPTSHFPFTDAATGSLGQGLSIGAGLAYLSKHEKLNFKTFVLMGDGELAEGQVWEAANFASYYKLNNLIAIADINRLGQSQETMFGHHVTEYVERFRAFGFEVLAIDGHDLQGIDRALSDAVQNDTDKPYVIIAKTHKGHGISFLQDKDSWHGKPLKKEDLDKALIELGDVNEELQFTLRTPLLKPTPKKTVDLTLDTAYTMGEEIATREVYGKVLAELGSQNKNIYALDAEVKNSTYSMDFLASHPERFVECFIAEQNMVGVAIGMQRIGKIPFVSTFASFLTRAADQIRMATLSGANINFVGSHAGISIGEDGASQMGLEDMSLFGTLPGSVVLHPSDALSTAKLLPELVKHHGISYLRTLRPKTPVIYENSDEFTIGGSKIVKKSDNDELTVVAAGITVHEAIKAAEELAKENISIRVVDCYSVKPIDKATLLMCLEHTKQKTIITVEDHFEHGGLGDFVLEAVSRSGAVVEKLAVKHISRSGSKDELLADAKIDTAAIIETVKRLIA